MRSADYVEMTTTSIASSGAGAVTCIAVTNRPTATTVFGSQATVCRYVIEDTVNKKFESGVGSFASLVLTRTKPQITWDGSTWNDLNPSALTFTGSPSSGDIKIRIAPVSNSFGPSLPNVQTSIAGDSTWRDYPLTNETQHTATNAGLTLIADKEFYQPYRLDRGGVLSGIQFEVITLASSTNLKMALYNCASDGQAGSKIVDFVTTATATTGVKTDTASASWTPAGKVNLAPGWYYIGYICNGAPVIKSNGSGSNAAPINPLGKTGLYGYGPYCYVAGSYTTGLPASPSFSGGTMGDPGVKGAPWFGLKVVP